MMFTEMSVYFNMTRTYLCSFGVYGNRSGEKAGGISSKCDVNTRRAKPGPIVIFKSYPWKYNGLFFFFLSK